MTESELLRKVAERVELLEEVVAQARDSCHCTRCYFCTALAALDKYDGWEEDE